MAAGMGSRYGGLKQIDPVGAHGEIIIDYSLFDARRAGFKKALFIIKEELLPDFQEAVFQKVSQYMEVEWVFQRLEDVPQGVEIPEGRQKPWGTGQATLAAARVLEDTPYAVINADDFYGREAFEKIYQFLKNAQDGAKLDFAMVGYYVKNTVTENGYVSRGVCQVEGGMLQSVTERTHIEKRPEGIAYTEDGGSTWNALAPDTVVSMNLWGFTPAYVQEAKAGFAAFLQASLPVNPMKCEYYLPTVVTNALEAGKADVHVLTSADKWHGITYREDKPELVEALKKMSEDGLYPVDRLF